jgi:NADP-dependent 3-hydroxy acid dehydrogenase YdfG
MAARSSRRDPAFSPALRRGQTALVTGAGSGIGQAIAIALAAEGLSVRLVGRDPRMLNVVAREIGSRATVSAVDITTNAGIAALARATRDGLDVLVHCAGAYRQTPLSEIRARDWAKLDAINLHAPVLLTTACLAQLRAAAGQVVFINSTAGLQTSSKVLSYAAGKHALRAAVDALRQELNPAGVRVLSVYPGRTDTPMQQKILAGEKRAAGPGMLMRPGDVAALVLAALKLPRTAEVTDIMMRPMRPLGSS